MNTLRLLYLYGYCGLGGVEVSIINKMKLLDMNGIYSEAIMVNLWTEGGKYILKYPRIKAGLNRDELKEELKKDYDIITVIDYPEFFNLIEELEISSKIIYETHNSVLSELKTSYAVLNHPRISSIIVPSNFNKEIIDRYVVHDKPINVVLNPLDMDLFQNISLNRISSELNKFEDRINILWVGRLQLNKNPIEFIQVGNKLLSKRKDLHFFIIGDICDDIEFFSFIKSCIPIKYKSYYTFMEFVPNEKMPELYSLAANTGGCLISTSNNESMPMIFPEAMACKCPVISSGVGGTKELIVNNETGVIYKLHDINAGCRALIKIIGDTNKRFRDRLTFNALELVRTRHSFARVADTYEDVLIKAVSERTCQSESKESLNKNVEASVIIPSYNRKDLLELSLYSFNNQDCNSNKFEVIVVDDGSEDGTMEMLKVIKTKYRLIVLQNERNLGAAKARNIGVKAANSEIIIFSDSDCIVPSNFITGHLRYHNENDKTAACGVISWRKVFSVYFSEFSRKQKIDFENVINTIPKFKEKIESINFQYDNNTKILSESDIGEILAYSYLPEWSDYFLKETLSTFGNTLVNFEYPWTLFGTGNVSLNKTVFYNAGTFDTDLPREEDWDIGYRLYKNGVKFIAAPELESIHQEHIILETLEKKMLESYRLIFNKYNDPEMHLFCLFNEGKFGLVDLSNGVAEYKRYIEKSPIFKSIKSRFLGLLQNRIEAYLSEQKETSQFNNISKELSILKNYRGKLENFTKIFKELSRKFNT